MNTKTLILFPDTNLFIQCRPLEQINWTELKEFDEIHLLVSRPVQSEIDNQKNRGNDRVGRRARAANGIFRDIILGSDEYKLIRSATPTVKLFIRPEIKPNANLSSQLDYKERDDQIVGIAFNYKTEKVDADIRLLTHDTGPMATAKMVGLAILPIPDDWLTPPEASESEQKIKLLEKEVARLRKSEPLFDIIAMDAQGGANDKIEFEFLRYLPMDDSEVSELMTKIVLKFPIATDFGPNEPQEREPKIAGMRISGAREYFFPASDEEIKKYKDEQYPKWLSSCTSFLKNFHITKQREFNGPEFTFAVTNNGTRPAEDVLITFEAKGDIAIMPSNHYKEGKQEEKSPKLSRPPAPPSGTWRAGLIGRQPILQRLENIERYHSKITQSIIGPGSYIATPKLPDLDLRRDQNAFYYKPNRPIQPASEFSLECEQWRHGIEAEYFDGIIYFDQSKVRISGAIECKIHAKNTSDVLRKLIPVRIKITTINTFEFAKSEVMEFISNSV